jgi:hypothetical protein
MELGDLVSLLAWTDPTCGQSAARWKEPYEAFLAARTRSALDAHPELREAYRALPSLQQRRVRGEPMLLRRLASPHPEATAPAFAAVLTSALDGPKDGFMDVFFMGPRSSLPLLWTRSAPSPPLSPATSKVQGADRALAEARVTGGAAFVAAVSGAAAGFVSLFLELLFLTAEDGDGYSSGSFDGLPGIAYVTNAHRSHQWRLPDVLVHEAVHGAIYMYETVCGPLTRETGDGQRLRSPWTGASLRLPAYVQACFVWYALVNFWRLALARTGADCGKMLRRAAGGFRRAPATRANRQALLAHTDPEVFARLQEIERRMTAVLPNLPG